MNLDDHRRDRLFTPRQVFLIAAVFVAALGVGWGAAQGVKVICGRLGLSPDVPAKWPLSMFRLMLPGRGGSPWDLLAAAGIAVGFWAAVRWAWRGLTGSLAGVTAAGLLLVVATNLIHGPDYGLAHPRTEGCQYYHDAQEVASPGAFLATFNDRQPELGWHSRTHPPGAVLSIWALGKLFGPPWAVSLAIAALSVVLTAWFFHGLLARHVQRDVARYATLLLLLVPAVQIYYCAALDALIAGLMLGVLWAIGHPRDGVAVAAGAACLFGASLLTFGSCFLGPVVLGYEAFARRSVRRSVAMMLAVGLVYLAMASTCGFDYLRAFRTASALENPGGFLLLADPVSYVMTRLENVAEILVFLGPFLLVLAVRGGGVARRDPRYRGLGVLAALGAGTLLAMFATGAFRTGETARACLFIYPYLLLPVAAVLDHERPGPPDRRLLAWLVFGQALVMQAIGGYFW